MLTLLLPIMALDISWSKTGAAVGTISEIIGIWILIDKRFN